MRLRKAVFDTNIYVNWFRTGFHHELLLGPGLVRYLCAVVQMELQAGATTLRSQRAVDQLLRAYQAGGRVLCPSPSLFNHAGQVLRQLRERGVEIRRTSLTHDVLIALSARSLGATLFTGDRDFALIRSVIDFRLELVGAP